MKPDIEAIRDACAGVDKRLLEQHFSRLSDRYFNSFSEKDICRHLTGLSKLSAGHPEEVILEAKRDGSVECTVLAFDYPSEFSLITGILAGMGFSIISGDVFTYERVEEEKYSSGYLKRQGGLTLAHDLIGRRRIIDHFSGVTETPLPFKTWAAEVRKNMGVIMGLLEMGGQESIAEAERRVNEMVVKRLAQIHTIPPPVLYPVQIEIDNESRLYTRLNVVSEDTPCFLYALSNALSLQNILIEHVRIRTIHGRIEDQIDLVDFQGRSIEDPDTLYQVKLSVLLTKQFTYFLGKAPDPYTALARFGTLVKDILQRHRKGQWIDLLTNPRTLQDLARLLGASDFLWEDFIRLQYETLLPMFRQQMEGRLLSRPFETMAQRLNKAMRDTETFDEQKRRLNEFKDHEIFLVDLDYILVSTVDFLALSERLTSLAQHVVNTAARLLYDRLVARFGRPRTVAGMEAKYTILGLGKMGGAALGYASDIELLFVYSDKGRTDGEESIENSDFFERVVKEVTQFITAKREGIFRLDLRLRPYGNAGPLACSLESLCRYYGQGGQAHSYERLALVRMRAIGGDSALGRRVERLRDEMIYFSKSIDVQELYGLRERQFKEKTQGGKLNAKFSPGGLVDLEYGVQILQVMHGKDLTKLRTPRLHEALTVLDDAGVLSPEETIKLNSAYGFLRHLTNGLRMLRGSAEDLFLPPVQSREFVHLARRLGYERGGPLDPAQQLRIDFETHTAMVRLFVEQRFGRDSLPGSEAVTVADLVLSDGIPMDRSRKILDNVGFKNSERAYGNLKRLAGKNIQRDLFARLALLACDVLTEKPDPDMALNNWERFINSLASPEFHYNLLLSQPMRLEILLGLFSGSQFLADTLVRNPGFLDWVIIPEVLHKTRKREDIEKELRRAAQASANHEEWLNKLRRIRRREILRIGTRDIFLRIPTRDIMMELSTLAEACIQGVFERAIQEAREEGKAAEGIDELKHTFCILALGKLGGNELNYSSDIDLIGLWDDSDVFRSKKGSRYGIYKDLSSRLMENICADLSRHTQEGYAYRVDLRLRPFGSSGELVPTLSGLKNYYNQKASLWEIQAALKARPVGGNLQVGYDFLKQVRPVIVQHRKREEIVKSIERMRKEALQASATGIAGTIDVKSGFGGLRDVEFLVQGLQLIHGPDNPLLLEGNTLTALDLLHQGEILPQEAASQLQDDYIFLRQIEHCLQILEDRQNHSLPKDPDELTSLAKRMLGSNAHSGHFMELLNGCLQRVHHAYVTYLF
ncbi:MAG: glutamate-ammonia-ligase adenylyltransferase [Pseudomonadota bacterium]